MPLHNGIPQPRGKYVDDVGNVICASCGAHVEERISHSERNPDRRYYKCFPCGDGKNKFYHWADDPAVAGAGTPKQQELPLLQVPSTPRPSQAQRATVARGAPLNASPAKRARAPEDQVPSTPSKRQAMQAGNSPFTPSHSLTPAQRKKRYAEIEASFEASSGRTGTSTSATLRNTPPSSQVSARTDVSEYDVGVQTDLLSDGEEAQHEFFSTNGRSALGRKDGDSYRLSAPPGNYTDEEEDEVEGEVSKLSPSSQAQAGPRQWRAPPSTPSTVVGNVSSRGIDRTPMPTPPQTTQRPTRIGRVALSREMDEEEDEGGNTHSPARASGSEENKKDMSNFVGMATDSDIPRGSGHSFSRQDSTFGGATEAVSSAEVESVRNVLGKLLGSLEHKNKEVEHWRARADHFERLHNKLRAKLTSIADDQ